MQHNGVILEANMKHGETYVVGSTMKGIYWKMIYTFVKIKSFVIKLFNELKERKFLLGITGLLIIGSFYKPIIGELLVLLIIQAALIFFVLETMNLMFSMTGRRGVW